ncbi:cell wall-binding repeat-containing protein [Bifidobacterium parmae]|uniref:Repeat protein n=1 Tax=Bifidobacterium parmae TaxID=361854 RepID=A0A2N5J3L4_9BIFI|nr:cell wall-binding repeat-containing protein [Bifidobacterium parmae]PLS28815.1 repeat protein [Bifidobacterium parmae]
MNAWTGQDDQNSGTADNVQIQEGDPTNGTLNGQTALGDPLTESEATAADNGDGNGKLRSARASSGTIPIPRTVIYQQTSARSMLNLVNGLRSGVGRSSLQWDTRLEQIAMLRAAEITEYFAHTRPNGQQPYTAADDLGYGSQIFVNGENIAAGSDNAQGTFNQWRNSPGHYQNMIEGSFKSVGMAAVYVPWGYGMYWVQCFSSDSGNGMNGSADNQQESVLIQLPDSFITNASIDRSDMYLGIGTNNVLPLPEYDVTIRGTYHDSNGQAQNQSVSYGVHYRNAFMTWDTGNENIAKLYSGSDGGVYVGGKNVGRTTVTGEFPTTSRLNLTLNAIVKLMARYGGATRYDTMAEIVKGAFSGHSDTVVVTSGDNYPDALASGALAGALDAPLVTTSQSSLSPQARERITALSPNRIVVIGGTNIIPQSTLNELRSLLPSNGQLVTGIHGSTRYETAEEIYKQGASRLGIDWSSTAIISCGDGYADALGISPYAYHTKAPIFLVGKGKTLPASIGRSLATGGFNRVVIVGSNTVVSDAVASQVRSLGISVTRLGGSTRYDTSVKVANWIMSTGEFDATGAAFASGENYPDALAGTSLAGGVAIPLLLVKDSSSPSISWARGRGLKITILFGSQLAISGSTASAIAKTMA